MSLRIVLNFISLDGVFDYFDFMLVSCYKKCFVLFKIEFEFVIYWFHVIVFFCFLNVFRKFKLNLKNHI